MIDNSSAVSNAPLAGRGVRRPAAVRLIVLSAAAMVVSTLVLHADTVDKRLAPVRKAFVVAVAQDDDDRAVATCLARRLGEFGEIQSVADRNDADVVLRISADLYKRTPRARLVAELPDGTKLWQDDERYRIGRRYGEPKTKVDFDMGVGCGLADVFAHRLNNAMLIAAGMTPRFPPR